MLTFKDYGQYSSIRVMKAKK